MVWLVLLLSGSDNFSPWLHWKFSPQRSRDSLQPEQLGRTQVVRMRRIAERFLRKRRQHIPGQPWGRGGTCERRSGVVVALLMPGKQSTQHRHRHQLVSRSSLQWSSARAASLRREATGTTPARCLQLRLRFGGCRQSLSRCSQQQTHGASVDPRRPRGPHALFAIPPRQRPDPAAPTGTDRVGKEAMPGVVQEMSPTPTPTSG